MLLCFIPFLTKQEGENNISPVLLKKV